MKSKVAWKEVRQLNVNSPILNLIGGVNNGKND